MVSKEFWKGKKVLITGHTGFKGSWLCMLLNTLGAKISGYSLEPPTEPSLYNLCNIDSFVQSTIGDIRDFETLNKYIELDKPEIVIHMAAQALVRLSYSNPVLTYQTNIIGTLNLLEAVRVSKEKTVRVVLNVTTDKCYENKEWIWAYRENEPLGGYDPYSSSKACSELITSAYRSSFFNPDKFSEHKVAIATARAGNVIGGGDWACDRLIPDIVKSILKDEKIIIRNPDSIRPWQFVLEPLTGYLMLSEKLYNGEISFADSWNFGPDDSNTKNVEWIVKRLCELWSKSASYEIKKDPQSHEATFLRLDSSKSRMLLGWYPKCNLEETLINIIKVTKAYCDGNLRELCQEQIENYLNS